MARKPSRCLRKNYKKKVKANAKTEKNISESANEIAALFKGTGDFESAKRTVAAVQNKKSALAKQNSGKNIKVKKALASAANVGGKKKTAASLAATRKAIFGSGIKKKTLFNEGDDANDRSDEELEEGEDDDDDNDDKEDNDAVDDDDEEDEDASSPHIQLPDLNTLSTAEQLNKYRSLLRKQQIREKMALREHVRELEKKKSAMRGGKNVAADLRREKRDLGKYIKQLEEEQKTKHRNALNEVELRIVQLENSTARNPFVVAAERGKARLRAKLLGASASANGIYQAGISTAFTPNVKNNFGFGFGSMPASSAFGFEGDNEVVGAQDLQNMFAHLM